MDYQKYLEGFERTIMIPMYQNMIYNQKPSLISLKPGKLHHTSFGSFIQSYFIYKDNLVLNFYGLNKLSTGLISNLMENDYLIKAPVLHFNSVKIEHIEKFNSDLLSDFVKFKKEIVRLRWKS